MVYTKLSQRKGGFSFLKRTASNFSSSYLILIMVIILSCRQQDDFGRVAGTDWLYYGGDAEGNRYSPLELINLANVSRLKPAWTYSTFHDVLPDPQKRSREIQCQPIVVDGIMYGTNAELGLFALNAASGEELWLFEPENERMRFNTNRGVMYWEAEGERRILYTAGTYLYAVDASSGKLLTDFGEGGIVDLRNGLSENLDHDITKLSVTATSPGIVHKNTLILGSSVSESGDAAPGHIRGYDVKSGEIKWVFRTIPQPGDPGYDTWEENAFKTIGGANNWSGMVLDSKRGVVYLGTGSPASDFYGGDRAGANLYANSVLALDTETGTLKWYFQTIHHDLWDRDISCPPNLLTINRNGKSIDVVAQATKDGLIYVLDRDTGISIFPVEEREVPVDGLPGEQPFPTQKFPLIPLSYQELTDSLITDISEESREFVRNRLKHLQLPQSKFLPPSEVGTMLFGYSGGVEWGGSGKS